MEIRTILGRKPNKLEVERKGKSITKMPPQVMLETPIMFSAMSFGSISLNAQKSLAMAAVELGTLFNTGEGGLHPDLRSFGDYAVVQVASGRFDFNKFRIIKIILMNTKTTGSDLNNCIIKSLFPLKLPQYIMLPQLHPVLQEQVRILL